MGRRRLVFFSHAWAPDGEGRDTHARVQQLARALERMGWRVWVDEREPLCGHLDVALARGICMSDVVALCLTTPYCRKVQVAAESPTLAMDNCLKEVSLVTACRKPTVPVVMEQALRQPSKWGALLCMRLGGHFFADASETALEPLSLHRILCGLFGGGPLCGTVLRPQPSFLCTLTLHRGHTRHRL